MTAYARALVRSTCQCHQRRPYSHCLVITVLRLYWFYCFVVQLYMRTQDSNYYDTIWYDIVYITCSKKLTCIKLSPPHGTYILCHHNQFVYDDDDDDYGLKGLNTCHSATYIELDSWPAAIHNLGSGSWCAWANGSAAHYVAIHCPR